MRKLVSIFIITMLSLVVHSTNVIDLNDKVMDKGGYSIAEHAEYFEDNSSELEIHDILKGNYPFEIIGEPNLNLGFTSSSYWVRFSFKSQFERKEDFILEVARSITNTADLYRVVDGTLMKVTKHGDDIAFGDRKIEHRKLLHEFKLDNGERVEYYLNVKSDGEVITLPITLWKYHEFIEYDYIEQFILGGYYGTLIFVIIIYFFFYRALRDSSFLYYVLYVASLLLFQLSIDGLAFQYLWPNNMWLGNHSVIIFAALTVFMVNIYAKTYLKTNKLLPFCEKIFKFFLAFSVVAVLLGFTSGSLYALAFPIVNGLALVSTIYILISIIIALINNCRVSIFFALAFVFLIVGTFLFILTNFSIIPKNMFTEHSIKFGSALEVIFLSISMAGKYQEVMKEKEVAQEKMVEQLEEVNKMKEDANVKLEAQVKERTIEIELRKEEIEEKNSDIMGSIHYSQRIQNAILPSQKVIDKCLPDSFVLYKPKDVVSGDFYWVAPVTTSTNEEVVLFSAADCTGHGVPGAFMSLIGNSYLKLSLSQEDVNSPAQALDFLNVGVNSTLQQNDGETLQDGMDIALCALFPNRNKLYYAGAKNPLYIIKNGELIEIKGDKHPIGAYVGDKLEPFTNHEIDLDGGETIYVFSDGFPDQFGGPKGKKFMYGKFKKLLIEIHQKPMKEQQQILWDTFEYWRGDLEQIDDVCIIGVRV